MSDPPHTAAVVGAGLAGLTAAYRLQQAGWHVTVLEREPKPGGRVETLQREGYTIDTGATAVGNGYMEYVALAGELGVHLHRSAQSLAIPRDGRLHLLAMNRMLKAGATTKLLSPVAKLRTTRLAYDVVRARRRGYLDNTDLGRAAAIDDETAHAYALRALGTEVDEYLVAPLTRTMMVADPGRISKVQLFSGIVNAFGDSWLAPTGGTGSLVTALAHRVAVVSDVEVRAVTEEPNGGVTVRYEALAGAAIPSGANHYDVAVIACPLPAATAISPQPYRARLQRLGGKLDYTQIITVSIGTTRRPNCPALMVLIPPSEDPEIALFFLDHNKTPGRTPEGHGLFTLYWEMGSAPARMEDDDEVLVARAFECLVRNIPELHGTLHFSHVRRWRTGLPHVREGVFAEIGAFVEALDSSARIQFAADYMSETGMNTAVALGARAAENLSRSHHRLGAAVHA